MIAALGLVLSTAAACPVAPETPPSRAHNLTPPSISLNADTPEVLSLVNDQRVAAGCKPLTVDGSMTGFAQDHANWMNNGGGLVHSLLGAPIMAENIAQGYDTPRNLVDAWLDSPRHKANLLNCAYTRTGIGVSGNYWDEVLG